LITRSFVWFRRKPQTGWTMKSQEESRLEIILFLLICFLMTSSGQSLSSGKTPEVWRHADVDYSAANEYVRAHYKTIYEDGYFSHSSQSEPIYNARLGFWDDKEDRLVPAKLSSCGFELQHAPTRVTDFKDLEQIQSRYIPELRENILSLAFPNDSIEDVIFWHPMYRGEGEDMNGNIQDGRLPTARIAPLAHVDTDVGALSTEELVTMITKNQIQAGEFLPGPLNAKIKEGKRFAILNLWRNANTDQPVLRAPLSVLSTRYNIPEKAFPNVRPNGPTSRWYCFPRMTPEECFLFLQYDRDVSQPSDLWHCALASIKEEGAKIRKSFDIRAFIVFDEVVPPQRDRFSNKRTRPSLTKEESGCFCDEQAVAEDQKVKAIIQGLSE